MNVTFARPNMDRKGRALQCSVSHFSRHEYVSKSDVLQLKKNLMQEGVPLGYLLSMHYSDQEIATPLGNVPNQLRLFPLTEDIPEVQSANSPQLPNPLQMYKVLTKEEALGLRISSQEADKIEEITRGQFDCQEWRRQRKGRITASYFGRVAKVKTGQENISLEIMGQKGPPAGLASLRHGRENEKKALAALEELMEPAHKDFQLTKSGLWVCQEKPFLGASPDALATCQCCEDAVVEVKCPSSVADLTIEEACKKKNFFLDEAGHLKPKHNHFYQIQGQMAVTGLKRCICVVYTLKDVHVEDISFDSLFWETVVQKLEHFFLNFVFPKILQE